jgi:hypothetical protein
MIRITKNKICVKYLFLIAFMISLSLIQSDNFNFTKCHHHPLTGSMHVEGEIGCAFQELVAKSICKICWGHGVIEVILGDGRRVNRICHACNGTGER